MKKGIKDVFLRTLKIIFISLLSIILLFNIYIMIQAKSSPNKVPSIFGYKPFAVMSGSMEPKIKKGDLIFVKNIDAGSLKVGDIIAFRNPDNTVTTHRINNVINSKNKVCYETKGDNNNTADQDITCSNLVEGKYVSRIAKVGSFIIFVQEPMGFTILMLTILIVCIFIYFISSKRIDDEMVIKDEEELEAFKEFKRAREIKTEEPDKKEDIIELDAIEEVVEIAAEPVKEVKETNATKTVKRKPATTNKAKTTTTKKKTTNAKSTSDAKKSTTTSAKKTTTKKTNATTKKSTSKPSTTKKVSTTKKTNVKKGEK